MGWIGLPFQALSLVPAVSSPVGGLLSLWYLVLLITTATSPTRHGLHDRFAGSATAQPVWALDAVDGLPRPDLPRRAGVVDPVGGRDLGLSMSSR